MLGFDFYRELRNGKKYKTNSGQTMSENCSTEDNRAGNSSENTEEEVPEIHTLTQEAVNEQIKGFIASLARQLEELTPACRDVLCLKLIVAFNFTPVVFSWCPIKNRKPHRSHFAKIVTIMSKLSWKINDLIQYFQQQ